MTTCVYYNNCGDFISEADIVCTWSTAYSMVVFVGVYLLGYLGYWEKHEYSWAEALQTFH